MALVLAFDTATHVATIAVLRDGEVVGERVSRAVQVLRDGAELLAAAGTTLDALDGVVVGTGPGSFTGVRIGLAAARGLALALEVPVAGVSTLDALGAGAPGALPVIDAGRREVFARLNGAPLAVRPEELTLEPGTTCVGDGAVRYRRVLESAGAAVPPDEDGRHVPHARLHARMAGAFDSAGPVEPVYVREPDVRNRT